MRKREPGHSGEYYGPRPIPGHGLANVAGSQGSEDMLETSRSEARPGHATKSGAAEYMLTGRDCCFSNHYSYNYASD